MSPPTLQLAQTAPVVSLADCRRADLPHVGAKCANLGELMSLGIDVPAGFAVTAEAFRRFAEANGLAKPVAAALAKVKGAKDPKAFQEASKAIRTAIERAPVPADVAAGIRAGYEDLCRDTGNGRVSVAVRSSATETSAAGQQDSYLNVQGADAVVRHVVQCWASLYTPRAIFYREQKGFPHDGALLAVAVQAMVESETSGVCCTLDPANGDATKCVIESTWGLGDTLADGQVQPDRFVLDKRTGAVLARDIAHKAIAHVVRAGEGLAEERAVPAERSDAPSLTHEEAAQLCEVARRIEEHFGGPQEVEFAIEWRGRRRVRIVQARPETAWSRKAPKPAAKAAKPAQPAPQAAATATAVAPAVPLPVTSTRIYVNLSLPDLAEKVAAETQADGVGLLRAEHLMLSLGKHPRSLIEEGGEDRMVEAFAEGIRKVAQSFSPRPVLYRFLDFKPDEYLRLPGGEKHERDAGHLGPNPLVGYRGCFRYTKEPDVFRLECRALRKVRDEHGLRNVHAMLPFVRTLREFRQAKRILEEEGLRRRDGFQVWIMVEVPATVFLIDQFLAEGLDGVSFGTNDLTMLVLGIDRDDPSTQEIYDERDPAVLRAMGHVLRACVAAGVPTSVCGQAPGNDPAMVEFLVREGATSLSVNPDKAVATRHLVASIERKVLLDGVRSLRNGKEGGAPPQWVL
ncbi:MAG: pyruvate, water dikinase [Thermoplasmata archaeon]|jgi:phosphoenolpyruvate synthase/pyruvate phosphate dikinase|nr:pyruvate, water dikinase [Thermoplasmata archaeon]